MLFDLPMAALFNTAIVIIYDAIIYRVIWQDLVSHRLSHHHTIRQVFNPCLRRSAILETDAVAHQFSWFHPLFLSDPARYADRRYSTRLRDADAAGWPSNSGLQQQLWDLRGFTAAGLAYYDESTVSAYLI